MNSDAASETQYEDSKSQLSTYRKDDKIMLKRKVLTLLLALVLVVSMAVPAFARTYSGRDEGGVIYTITIVDQETSGSARFQYGATVNVTLYGSAIVTPADGSSVVANRATGSGAGSAYVSLTNGTYGSTPISAIVATAYAGTMHVRSVTEYC